MLLKYTEVCVKHNSKNYEFKNNHLEFDQFNDNIIFPADHIINDIKNHICYAYDIFTNMVNSKLYSSIGNIERAIRTDALSCYISIIYCNDIDKCDNKYSWIYSKKIKTLNDVNKYCSGIKYEYDLKTKEIKRYEIYGDIILGDYIERDESYYDKFK